MPHKAIKKDEPPTKKATLGSYLVGAYLFSVPTFSYAAELDLNYIPQWFGTIVVLYAVFDFIRNKAFNIPNEIKLYGLFIFWLLSTTLLLSEVKSFDSLFTLIKVGVVTLSVTQLIKSDRDFFNAIFIYGTSILFVAYLNYEILLYLKQAVMITGMDRFDGTMANANTAAIYAISVLWLSFLFLTRPNTSPIIKIICVVFAGFALYIIYFSGSKKGMIGVILFAFLAAGLIFQKYRFSLSRTIISLVVGIILILSAIYFVSSSPFSHRLEAMVQLKELESTGKRLYLFKTAIAMTFDSGINFVLGIGHDNFRDHNIWGAYSHSTISEVLVSSGIIGFFMYFSALGLLCKKLYAHGKQLFKTPHFMPAMNCLLFMVLILFFNATAVLYSGRELWPLIGTIGAYSLFLSRTLSIDNAFAERTKDLS